MRAPRRVINFGNAAAQVELKSCDAALFMSKFRPEFKKKVYTINTLRFSNSLTYFTNLPFEITILKSIF
jgi:hypothetical protein